MLKASNDSVQEFPSTGLPHSREAEEAVIGSILINPYLLDELADLQPEDFYIHRLRFIWQAYLRLREKKQDIDSLTVSEELEDMGRLEEIGGPAYLTALLNCVPTTLHAESYALIVQSTSMRRRLLTAANKIATLAYDESTHVDEIAGLATAAVRNAVESFSGDASHSFAEIALELYDRAVERSEAARAGKPILSRRIPTSWDEVNRILNGGFVAGKLYVVAARPGDGKTTWLANVCLDAALSGKQAVFFSLEMEDAELVARILSGESGLDANKITDGILADDDWAVFVGALDKVSGASGRVEYTPNLTVDRLRAKAHRIQQKHGLDLLIVDYVQLMRGTGRTQNREQEVAAISRELKILAGELGVPVIAAAQLSREIEKRTDKKPLLSDLRESGAIEQDSDAVIFLWRPDKTGQITNISFAKHRGGAVGSVDLYFDKAVTKFRNLAEDAQ